jgi:hypothetical protein
MRRNGRGSIGLLAVLGVTVGALAGCSSTQAQGSPGATTTGASPAATDTASPTGSPATASHSPSTPATASNSPSTSATATSGSPSPSVSAGGATTATTGTTTATTGTTTATTGAGAEGKPANLTNGSSGPQVLAVQQRLAALGYWIGTPDGRYGGVTAQAVTALQKAAGLSRDGVLGPKTRGALDRSVRPSARSKAGHVLEVDKKRQLLLVVDDGRISRILNASTGSGQYYDRPGGGVGHAVTPAGRYRVGRAVNGWDDGPLGSLYRPRYFNGGIAVHGYPSVPSYPASHGCVRVSLPAMDMIWKESLLPKGAAVWVY